MSSPSIYLGASTLKSILTCHSDKVAESDKPAAHVKFQEIAFAYAILSDQHRRQRYDTTGSTSESLGADEANFSWTDFFRAQWAEAVTGERLSKLKFTYQHSDEEKRDVLHAYTAAEGKLDKVFKVIILSNPLDDEERFREYIDGAIKNNEVPVFNAYVNESQKTRNARYRKALHESKSAEDHARKLGIYDTLFGKEKDGASGNKRKRTAEKDETELATLLDQRGRRKGASFLEKLEAKYVGGKGAKSKNKEEPSEEAFQKTASRLKKQAEHKITNGKNADEVNDEGEDEIDLKAECPDPSSYEDKKKRKSVSRPTRSSTRSKKSKVAKN